MRSRDRISSILARLIADDWDIAVIRVWPVGDSFHVRVQLPDCFWDGTLSAVEYHALIQRGIGQLGTVPRVMMGQDATWKVAV